MKTKDVIKKAVIDNSCDIVLGIGSWDNTSPACKYQWYDKNGKACRGGEFPVGALPQMAELAINNGYLKRADFKF